MNGHCHKIISEFNENFITSYKDESEKGNFLEVGVQYPEHLNNLRIHLPFLPLRMKIKKLKKL